MLVRGTTLVVERVSSPSKQPSSAVSRGEASFVLYYGCLVSILTSPSAQDKLYLKPVPRFSTETPQEICTGGGESSVQGPLWCEEITCQS